MSSVASTPVVFNYPTWALRYPELSASVVEPQAQLYFNEAQLYCDNSVCSVVPNLSPIYERATLLNMVTAHIAALNASLNGEPSSPLVGRINNATQGSVTAATEMQYPPGSAQWFMQSKYGAAFWQASTKYRSMRYAPGPPGAYNPFNRSFVRLF